jgi:CBS domain-containing protein
MAIEWSVQGITKGYKNQSDRLLEQRESQKNFDQALMKAQRENAFQSDWKEDSQQAFSEAAKTYEKVSKASSKQRERVFRVKDLMSDPVYTVLPKDSLQKAYEKMGSHSCRHLVVVNESYQLTGILSDRDLLSYEKSIWSQTKVESAMTERVLTCSRETTLREIAGVMLTERFSAVPVVEEKKLLGLITVSDILRSLWNHAPLDLWS